MTPDASKLLSEALTLPVQERAHLIGDLIESLDEDVDEDADAAWDTEIARRVQELNAGTAKTVSWEQVRRRVRGILRGE
ncbi:MAG: addiction module protein [Phycisphaeraceae bacterium]